ncbi:tetratricopeptide repeat protein [Methanomethylovorans sp.]|uniref:tetratricopeptide repeat protein n=1 Tax=Methanomethylovorans sp. TaxID=2758717 RepID=UPI00351C4E0A
MGLMDDVKSKKKQKEAENWFNMGIKSQDPEKKLDYFTRSLELDPNNVSAWLKRGRILEDLSRFDEAKRSYDRATLLDPSLDIRVKKTNSFPEEDTNVPDMTGEQTEYAQEETQYTPSEEDYLPETPEEETESVIAKEIEEVVPFTPPQGEESLFSNIRKTEVPASEEEKDLIPTNPESVKSSEVISFNRPEPEIVPDDNVPRQNVPDKINETVVITSSPEPKNDNTIKRDIPTTSGKNPTAGNTSTTGKERKQIQMEKAGISSYVEMDGKNANLRIPISETIKFWLVGAIVLLVLYLITRLI